MSFRVLTLRRLSRAQARISQRLALEPWMQFEVDGRAVSLKFRANQRQEDAPSLDWFSCGLGSLGLSEAQAVLNAWSSCPAFLTNDTQASWVWHVYSAGVAEPLATVLGELQSAQPPADVSNGFTQCLLTMETEHGRVESVIMLSTEAFARWLEQPVWNANRSVDHSGLRVSFALRLGRLSMPYRTLDSLRPGDVVCPSDPNFDTAGNGVLILGTRRLYLRAVARADRLQMEVIDIEENSVTDDWAESDALDDRWADDSTYMEEVEPANEQNNDAERGYLGREQRTEELDAPLSNGSRTYEDDELELARARGAFADLALNLTLRCGQISLTIGELASLAPGAVLEVPGITPGLAELYYGQRRLAQGELVDVEGRLGLQITQMDEGRG
jgi:type III secretion protein Q